MNHAFLEFVKTCFGQKRKTLANNLRGLAEPARMRELLEQFKLRADARAEQLSVGSWRMFTGLFLQRSKEKIR